MAKIPERRPRPDELLDRIAACREELERPRAEPSPAAEPRKPRSECVRTSQPAQEDRSPSDMARLIAAASAAVDGPPAGPPEPAPAEAGARRRSGKMRRAASGRQVQPGGSRVSGDGVRLGSLFGSLAGLAACALAVAALSGGEDAAPTQRIEQLAPDRTAEARAAFEARQRVREREREERAAAQRAQLERYEEEVRADLAAGRVAEAGRRQAPDLLGTPEQTERLQALARELSAAREAELVDRWRRGAGPGLRSCTPCAARLPFTPSRSRPGSGSPWPGG
jgi:hypothetical protein